ncbi:DNA primase [Candidatus Scalindua japonica]|uniref:DNA primase n=1 Tax=Candidatus Scalindua japonica TaxID=1284222 RepID=A0A286TXH2_9BACT|nr:DUF1844 domain-containing protein [Candidatus Scalindua japonica]GAX60511.1 DNA primase [Candidatus Scalindua japonica]
MDDDGKLKQSGSDIDNEVYDTEQSTTTEKNLPKIPEASFSLFISSLVTQALISMGEVDNPFSKTKNQNLDQAKFTIDTLQIIKDKTCGNLADEEEKLLDTALYDLRMRYVEKSK